MFCQICSTYSYRSISVEEYISDTCRAAAQRNSNLEQRGTQYPSYDCKAITNICDTSIKLFSLNYIKPRIHALFGVIKKAAVIWLRAGKCLTELLVAKKILVTIIGIVLMVSAVTSTAMVWVKVLSLSSHALPLQVSPKLFSTAFGLTVYHFLLLMLCFNL